MEESHRDGGQRQRRAGSRPNAELQEHSTEKTSQTLSETLTLCFFFFFFFLRQNQMESFSSWPKDNET